MKRNIVFVYMVLLTFCISTGFAADPEKKSSKDEAKPENSENKLSEEELSKLKNRVEEIRDMDKTELTNAEKRELRKELKVIKETVRADGGYIYIGAGTLLVIILLVILLI
ncbi:MAG TPA: hypothetical protein VHO50_03185 [Bacteroidales bacterium]|nr:hypothetical protein [Bacteroidales bacterium]